MHHIRFRYDIIRLHVCSRYTINSDKFEQDTTYCWYPPKLLNMALDKNSG